MSGQSDKTLPVGKISGVFGVRGWLRVFSYTAPPENILNYSPWIVKKGDAVRTVRLLDGKLHGRAIVVQLEGVADRDQAEALMGSSVCILKEQLPKTREGEYYWNDLIGLKVETCQGLDLGLVDGLMETGANDVLIVKGERERAIPFLQGRTIRAIDLDRGVIQVDWDPDF
ncbi:MAG: ribosome maturation factor RimM [Gammaproteobacteria bacterium]